MKASEVDKKVCYAYQEVTGVHPDGEIRYAPSTAVAQQIVEIVREKCCTKPLVWLEGETLDDLISRVQDELCPVSRKVRECYWSLFGTFPTTPAEYVAPDNASRDALGEIVSGELGVTIEWVDGENLAEFINRAEDMCLTLE